jgi:3-methyladenine DNA glycosylase/8-oxoguanine DNA glycosylase
MVRTLGPRCERTGLRDVPSAARVAALAPARLCSFDLTETRAIAMVRAAREVAAGRVDLHGDHEAGWRRLEQIRGIGRWTTEILAVHGQGRFDVVPAGDLGFLKLVGRLQTGRPNAVAPEEDVRELFAPYGEWQGLAAAYALRLGPERLARATGRAAAATRPARRGTRWSPRPPLPEPA